MPQDDLVRRAFAAYFRSGGTDQPSNTSRVRRVGKLNYVRLHNARGLLAVYRVDTVGRLKRLRRWPKELED